VLGFHLGSRRQPHRQPRWLVGLLVRPTFPNLDPESGGLVIWDAPAPLDWDFARYNNDTAAVRNFPAQAGARSITVPHRANRTVIFDSNLFHETDRIAFEEAISTVASTLRCSMAGAKPCR
jgi:hypothetical protein